MNLAENIERLIEKLCQTKKSSAKTSAELDKKILDDAVAQLQTSAGPQTNFWRTIMKNRIAQLAAAAVIVVGISMAGWFLSSHNNPEITSSFSLLSNAYASEQTLFKGAGGIVHIINEIILYPDMKHDAGTLLNDLELETTQEKNVALMKRWLSHSWLPIYSLRTDGHQQELKLDITEGADEKITISDVTWYDSDTGRFARVLKTGSDVFFGNAYDGAYIYLAQKGPDGALKVKQEAVTGGFKGPDNPADFLGIAAGIKGCIPWEHFPPIQDVATETLQDGSQVRAYKLGFTDPWEKLDTYFLFKINNSSNILGEMECVVDGKTTRVHRRVLAEKVDKAEISWNLAELSGRKTGQDGVDISASTGVNIVTAGQMAQRAASAVYVFAKAPPWADEGKIYDLPDEINPPARFFAATYQAKDGRDVTLAQGESFNRYFAAIFKKQTISWAYESENGFKALRQNDKEGEMWWTEFALKSSGFEPCANRAGHILMSPNRTYLLLAINGPVSEQELKGLIDSLIPAGEYVPSSVQP